MKQAALRLAAVVALRKNDSPLASQFLKDSDPQVVIAAARAIHDLPVDSAVAQIGCLDFRCRCKRRNRSPRSQCERTTWQVRQTQWRLPGLQLIAKLTEARRIDALDALLNWENPPPRDAVLGAWRPLPKRDWTEARDALATFFAEIVGGSETIAAKAIEAAGKLHLLTVGESIAKIVEDKKMSDETRAAALRALAAIEYADFDGVVQRLERDFDALPDQLVGALVNVLAKLDAVRGLKMIINILGNDNLGSPDISKGFVKQQMAIQTLGAMTDKESAATLSVLMNAIVNGDYVDELRLDVVNACTKRLEPDVVTKLQEYRDSLLNPERSHRSVS